MSNDRTSQPGNSNENQPPAKPPRRRPPPLPRKPNFQPAPELQPETECGPQPEPTLVDPNGDWRTQIAQAETPAKKILTPAEMYADAKNRPAGQKIRRPYADRTRPKKIPSEITDKETAASEAQKKKKRTSAHHPKRTEKNLAR